MPPAVSPKEFLQALWGDQVGVAELTTLSPSAVKPKQIRSYAFFYPGAIDAFVTSSLAHSSRNVNVHMGVCLRREEWPQGGRGTEELALSTHVVWVDLDFEGFGHKGRVVKKEDARKLLAEFPLKPSMVVDSGAGIHVYWVLREPAVGAEIWAAKKINRILGQYFGGDTVGDMARVLRVPGTANFNHGAPSNAFVSYWHPERQYVLDDFDIPQLKEAENSLSNIPVAPPVSTPSMPPSQTIASPGAAPAPMPTETQGPSVFEPRVAPTLLIPDENIQKIGELLASVWTMGRRHAIALHLAGWFAGHHIVAESTKRVVSIASDLTQGDTLSRLKDVNDTYKNFELGKEITGRTSLEQLIDKDPNATDIAKAAEKKVLQEIQKLLPKIHRKKKDVQVEPDFDVEKIVKFDSRPARYQVCIKKLGKEYIVPCELEILTDIKRFRKSFFETSVNQFINNIAQWRWEKMISEAPVEVKPAPAEATTSGSIQTAVESWLDERREKPDLGELKTFPGYNETEIYFTLEGLKNRLRDKQVKATDREITHILRDGGWQDGRKWVGAKNPRLWFRALSNGNGHNGNGNGHHVDGPGEPKDPLPTSELFPKEHSKAEALTSEEGS